MTPTTMPEAVASAITAVMAGVGYIQKKGENKFHNYKFTAIGDVMAKLQPAMAEAGLIVIQDELAHEMIAGDNVMTATYAFRIAHKSGVEWDGQARHTGMAGAKNSKGGFDDKALNKCHTAARKYFLMALFQVPTGEAADPDADGDHAPANSNGEIGKPAPTLSDREESIAWAQTVIGGLDKIKTVAAFDKWEAKAHEKLDHLFDLAPETFKILKPKLTERRAALVAAEAKPVLEAAE